MAAPTGVNEELPQEPTTAGRHGPATAELAAAEKAAEQPTEPDGDLAEEASAELIPAEAEHAEAEPAEADPAEAKHVEAESASTRSAGTEPAEAARADAELAEAEPAEAGLAGAEPAGAEPAGAELAGAGELGLEAREESQAAEESRDVGPLAVVGIIIGIIALVGVAAGVLAMITHGFKPKRVVTYRPAAVYGLRPGQCVNSGRSALNFTVVSCASPHDAEVFAAFSLPAAAWPGASAVRQEADDGCASRLSGYLNPQLATIGLTQQYVYPNHAAWQAGQRTVVCEVSAGSGRLTGSVRAKG